MRADKECFACCRKKAESLLEQYKAPESVRVTVMEQVDELLEKEENQEEMTAPVLMSEAIAIVEKHIDVSDAYDEPKRQYNSLLLEKEAGILSEMAQEKDPFLAGVRCAITGNYIDFGAMSDVNEDKLNELLMNRTHIELDQAELEHLKEDLKQAKKLAYITDNAGEIVLDKLFIGELKKLYPELEIAVIVRGCPILNDATCTDAEFVGMDKVARIISNGTGVPGTPLGKLSEEAEEWIDSSDLCIAKGQGNFETLRGCNRNIYYLFLCKCELFVKKFQVERFTPVLSNELRIVQYA